MHYRKQLLTIANQIGAHDRSPVNIAALVRVRGALGIKTDEDVDRPPDPPVRERLTQYILALRHVLAEMATVNQSSENQIAVSEVESALGGLL